MAGTIEYSITKGNNTVTHNLRWPIAFALIDKPRTLLSFAKESAEPIFQVKLGIYKDNNAGIDMVLSFLNPDDACIKYAVKFIDDSIGHCLKVDSDFQMIEKGWDRVSRLNQNHIYVKQWSLGQYVDFIISIEFTVLLIDTTNNNTKAESLVNAQGFFITSLFSDAVIKSCDGKEYKVHKVILSSWSDVFKANFEHDMTKCDIIVVESPFESDVLEAVLSFIYGDEESSIKGIPEKVLAAADYYQLWSLKILCEKELSNKLAIENSIEFLELADLFSAEVLQDTVLNFIKDKAELIVKTEAWVELKSATLIKRIFENAINHKKEIIFYECQFI